MITVGKVTSSTLGQAVVPMTAVGDILLGTTDSGVYSVPVRAAVIPVAVVGLTSVPLVSIGTNAPDYDNVVPVTELTGLTVSVLSGGVGRQIVPADIRVLAGGTGIYLRVHTAAVATTYVCKVGVEVAED